MKTILYLVRHAHTEWSEDDERPLSAAGREAAEEIGARLASEPIVAVYTSPSRRSVETIQPLADRLGLIPGIVPDLRERELPRVPSLAEFEGLVRDAWDRPGESPRGGESNLQAQARGLGALREAVARHAGAHVVLATHGNLLALILNGRVPTYGYEFWCGLTFPDIYQVIVDGSATQAVQRLWNDRASR